MQEFEGNMIVECPASMNPPKQENPPPKVEEYAHSIRQYAKPDSKKTTTPNRVASGATINPHK